LRDRLQIIRRKHATANVGHQSFAPSAFFHSSIKRAFSTAMETSLAGLEQGDFVGRPFSVGCDILEAKHADDFAA
jgi:hypothetical protein